MILDTPIISGKKEEEAAASTSSSEAADEEIERVFSPPPSYTRKPKPKSVRSYEAISTYTPTQAQMLANPNQPTKASTFASGIVIVQNDGRVSKDEHKTGWVLEVGDVQVGQTFSMKRV